MWELTYVHIHTSFKHRLKLCAVWWEYIYAKISIVFWVVFLQLLVREEEMSGLLLSSSSHHKAVGVRFWWWIRWHCGVSLLKPFFLLSVEMIYSHRIWSNVYIHFPPFAHTYCLWHLESLSLSAFLIVSFLTLELKSWVCVWLTIFLLTNMMPRFNITGGTC